MNDLAKTLLSGTALCALATTPAMAQDVPHPSVAVLHAGNVVNKTAIHDPGRQNVTYTFSQSSSFPSSDFGKTLKFAAFKFNSSGNICSNPKTKIKITKKPEYGKAGVYTYTETNSATCSEPIVFYGAKYKLTNPAGEGQPQHFTSSLIGKFKISGAKYKGTINVNETVTIG